MSSDLQVVLPPVSDSLSLRLHLIGLTLLHTATHWLIMQKAHGRTLPTEVDHSASIACRHRVSDSFHSRFRVLFTFPSRYWFTIGRKHVFSLGRWSFRIPTGFHVSRGTWDTARASLDFTYRAITFYGRLFQSRSIIR